MRTKILLSAEDISISGSDQPDANGFITVSLITGSKCRIHESDIARLCDSSSLEELEVIHE